MLITTHTILGGTIGNLTKDPYLTIPLSFSAHYLVDSLPHFEVSSFRKPNDRNLKPKNWFEIFFVGVDILFSIFLILILRKFWSLSFFLGIAFGVLPDFLDNIFLWSSYLRKLPIFKDLYSLHKNFHFTARKNTLLLGILIQVFIIGFCFLLLKVI